MDKLAAEVERLQEAVWTHEEREAELRRALEAAVPLLFHVCTDRGCRRCLALEKARAALARD